MNAVDLPATFCSLFHPEVRKRAIHAPILAQSFALTTAAAAPSPLASLLPSRKEQSRGTLRERMERHPRLLPSKRKKGHTRRVLRGAE